MYNFLYEIIKKDIKNEQSPIEKITSIFSSKYKEYLINKKKEIIKRNEDGRNKSVINIQIKEFDFWKNDNNDEMNDSFSSCKSSKEVKNVCASNQKKLVEQ